MAARKILIYPDPFLHRVAKEVTSFHGDLQRIVREMIETMASLGHCIGIAANQVGVEQRIFVMDTSRRNKSSQGLVVLINPFVQTHGGSTYSKEGCLSLPPYLGRVGRSENVTLSGFTESGEKKTWSFTGLDAICAQHELDHLNGMLFIDRLTSLRSDLSMRKMAVKTSRNL